MIETEEQAVQEYLICEYMLSMVGKSQEDLKTSLVALKPYLVRMTGYLQNALLIEQKQAQRELRKLNLWISDEGGGNYLVRSRGRAEPYKIDRMEAREEIKERFRGYVQILEDSSKPIVSL